MVANPGQHADRVRKCPPHNNGPVITDTTCHGHVGQLHQFFHNAHCVALGCPFALTCCKKYADVTIHAPRNMTESIILRVEKILGERLKNRIERSERIFRILVKMSRKTHWLTSKIFKPKE